MLVVLGVGLRFLGRETQMLTSLNSDQIKGLVDILVVSSSFAVIIFGLARVFINLRDNNQSIGPSTIRLIGVILFLPTLVIISIMTQLDKVALATLLGTVAGCILSDSTDTAARNRDKPNPRIRTLRLLIKVQPV
jgi:hypothetical protein